MKCSPHIIATGRPVHATGHSDADLHPLAEAASARPPRLLSPPARAPGRTSPCSPRFGLRLRSPRKGDRAVTGNGVLRFEFPHVPEHGCVSVCVCMSCACCVVHMLYVWCVCHMYVVCALCVYVCKCVVCIHILCVLCVLCVCVCKCVVCICMLCVLCVCALCVCMLHRVLRVCTHVCTWGMSEEAAPWPWLFPSEASPFNYVYLADSSTFSRKGNSLGEKSDKWCFVAL